MMINVAIKMESRLNRKANVSNKVCVSHTKFDLFTEIQMLYILLLHALLRNCDTVRMELMAIRDPPDQSYTPSSFI